MSLLTSLLGTNFVMFPRDIAKVIGTNEALVFAELISEYSYWVDTDRLEDGWFYSTAENLANNTTLTEKQIIQPIKNLIDVGLIEKKIAGCPARTWYRINEKEVLDKLERLLSGKSSLTKRENQFIQNGETGLDKMGKLVSTKGRTNNNNYNNKDNNNINKNNISSFPSENSPCFLAEDLEESNRLPFLDRFSKYIDFPLFVVTDKKAFVDYLIENDDLTERLISRPTPKYIAEISKKYSVAFSEILECIESYREVYR